MLAIEGLNKHYGQRVALEDITLTVEPGEIVALLGANGSGKTTTINSVCNLIEFDSGDIRFEGKSIRDDKQYLANIGAVLGGSRNINWRLTTSQNAQYFAALKGHQGKTLKSKIAQLEEQLGLAQYSKMEVLKLSTGNKQKASLLCALAYSPKLLLLDEPTLGLDFNTVSELQQIIEQQSEESGQSYLVTSHDMSFIDKICQKVVVIEQGKVIFRGSIAALKSQLYTYRLTFDTQTINLEKTQQAIASQCVGHYNYEHNENSYSIQYETPDQVLGLLSWLHRSNINLCSLTMTKLSMEEAYQSLTTKRQV